MSDQVLVSAYLSGNKSAFDALTLRYLKLVYSIALRYAKQQADAEDLTQDVFVKVLQNLRKYDANKAFKPWIVTIAKHVSLDWLKKKKPLLFATLDPEQEEILISSVPDPMPLPDMVMQQVENKEMIRQAVQGLTPEQQEVLRLRYERGFTFREIADELGEILDTVKARHRRGLLSLKKGFSQKS